MQDDWDLKVEKPKFAIPRLASLQVESPSNSQTREEIGVLVALWCGRENIQIDMESTLHQFNVGFTVGELEITVKNGRIASQNRYKQEFYREEIDQNARDISKRDGKAGALFGFELPSLFSGAKLSVEGGGKISKDSVTSESKNGNYYRVYWRVSDAGHNRWKCFGYGLNEQNVLENKILGDDILCFIVPDDAECDVEIVARYYCDLRDIWFEYQHDEGSIAGSNKQPHHNREVVASAILARALNRSSRRAEGESGRRLVLLCQQRIIAKRRYGAQHA